MGGFSRLWAQCLSLISSICWDSCICMVFLKSNGPCLLKYFRPGAFQNDVTMAVLKCCILTSTLTYSDKMWTCSKSRSRPRQGEASQACIMPRDCRAPCGLNCFICKWTVPVRLVRVCTWVSGPWSQVIWEASWYIMSKAPKAVVNVFCRSYSSGWKQRPLATYLTLGWAWPLTGMCDDTAFFPIRSTMLIAFF